MVDPVAGARVGLQKQAEVVEVGGVGDGEAPIKKGHSFA